MTAGLWWTTLGWLQEFPGGSHTTMGYIGLGLGAFFILVLTVLTIRYLIRPGEKGEDHIKRRILEESEGRRG